MTTNVCDVIIVHVISADTQTNKHGKHRTILGPVGCTLHTWLAGKSGQRGYERAS